MQNLLKRIKAPECATISLPKKIIKVIDEINDRLPEFKDPRSKIQFWDFWDATTSEIHQTLYNYSVRRSCDPDNKHEDMEVKNLFNQHPQLNSMVTNHIDKLFNDFGEGNKSNYFAASIRCNPQKPLPINSNTGVTHKTYFTLLQNKSPEEDLDNFFNSIRQSLESKARFRIKFFKEPYDFFTRIDAFMVKYHEDSHIAEIFEDNFVKNDVNTNRINGFDIMYIDKKGKVSRNASINGSYHSNMTRILTQYIMGEVSSEISNKSQRFFEPCLSPPDNFSNQTLSAWIEKSFKKIKTFSPLQFYNEISRNNIGYPEIYEKS